MIGRMEHNFGWKEGIKPEILHGEQIITITINGLLIFRQNTLYCTLGEQN